MTDLYTQLKTYAASPMYPFHMPGHKRRLSLMDELYGIDISEVEGFDNLHDAHGILSNLQSEAAAIYGTKQTHYLINGSTCGILAAICAAVQDGENTTLYLARNAHRSAYHGAMLSGAQVQYVTPRTLKVGLCGDVRTLDIPIETVKDNSVFFVTSPTYDGIVSDIAAIAEAVHQKNGILIVDEAHGAHFPFDERSPKSAIDCGADLVIQSLHKTLPSLTQTALLHRCSDRVSEERLSRFLEIYETSSPSYVLMSSICACIRFVSEDGDKYFENLHKRIDNLTHSAVQLEKLHLIWEADFSADPPFALDRTKLLLSCEGTTLSGEALYHMLISRYQIHPEMAARTYCLALSSLLDDAEGFDRLLASLFDIDKQISRIEYKQTDNKDIYCEVPAVAMPLREAFDRPREWVSLHDAAGRISADYLYFYPPGIPLVTPGEVLSADLIDYVNAMCADGFKPNGRAYRDGRLAVII